MNRDQKFFDRYSLVLGILGAIALAILVAAMKMSDMTQSVYTRDGDEYQAAIADRIRPLGEVYLPGEELQATGPVVEAAAAPEPVAEVLSGPQVYNSACIACHGTGVAGAPMVGDTDAWTPRIAQGADILNDHAINGFGLMIAKGGRNDLSDDDVTKAVTYMVDESQ